MLCNSDFSDSLGGGMDQKKGRPDKGQPSKVIDMNCMFYECKSYNQPLNNWDVSNVINMKFMFVNCNSFNQPLNNWDVSNVKNNLKIFHNRPIEEKYQPKFS